MAISAQGRRGDPKHVLRFDPFEEIGRYLVVELAHGEISGLWVI